jgi:alkylation response protein AidB-like acyl-CoA dehydrogenase
MNLEPNDLQRAVVETARSFARERVAPGAAARDRDGEFPVGLMRELGALGLLAVATPEEAGGAGAGAVAYVLALMELAAADCSVAVTVGVTNMVTETIARFGTEAQRHRFCPGLASGELVAGAFGLSEPGAGSDAAAMRTRATRRGDRWVLDGEKQWITSGDHAGVIVVWAKSDPSAGVRGVSAFLVPAGVPGLTVGRHEHKMGIRGSTTVSLSFDGCELPADALLGREGDGFSIAMAALDGGRCGIAAQATGTMRAALDASVRYAQERRAFGQPIGDFQAIRFALADMKTSHDAARLLTLRAAWLKERGQPFAREASMAKVFATEAAQAAVRSAVQIHGGYGYTDEFPVERYFRDARVQTIYEGTTEIQRLVIAREILR